MLVLLAVVFCQNAFEVASVKLHDARPHSIGISTSGARLNAEAETLMGLILYAYNLRNYQIARTPALTEFGDDFCDVVAKAEGDAAPSNAEFRQMLRTLLADRFGLKAHSENREMPVYALLVGKNGAKLKESAPDATGMSHIAVNGRNYVVTIPKATMADILRAIENSFPDRPVIDATGLTGTYDLTLNYTPDVRSNRENPDPGDLSIFTAVQQQPGLRLEPRKAMVDVLVVDSVEKPAGN